MSCPKCGLRQWNYDENTKTCKNGHRIPVGKKYWRPSPARVIPASVSLGFIAGLLVERL